MEEVPHYTLPKGALKWDFWKNLGICPNLEMGDGVLFKLVYFICTEKALSNGTTKWSSECFWQMWFQLNTFFLSMTTLRGRCIRKSKKKLTSVSFMYVGVAGNAELLFFFYFFFCTFPIGNFRWEGRFWTTTLPHHTPPPIPKLSSITKTRILFVFLPKKVPVFCLYFYKNEPVWRIRHTALSDFSLNTC